MSPVMPPLGKLLSDRGRHRLVYEAADDASLVVKIARDTKRFVNLSEWAAWLTMQEQEMEEWLAPAVACCPGGSWLIMKRTSPVGDAQVPTDRPEWFTDIKARNWGRLNGRVVLHDYHQLTRHWK